MGLTSAIHFCRIAHVSRLDSGAVSKHCGPEGKNFPQPFHRRARGTGGPAPVTTACPDGPSGHHPEAPLTETDCTGLPLPENVSHRGGGTAWNSPRRKIITPISALP